ncbi:ATP-grasp domain-containing protein [Virgibacillus sp. C22-A2]|uniref:ATP-grasp domain-containing protein n=2 Tax=Virgibacillus tibetensis TaxID=3042313 RepID=A0ABU6KAG5_9BACI|nr:ATP-grasp domain-containing protein [Virgibacillus sp. C22-A2]
MKHGWLIYSRTDIKQNKSYINWFIEEANSQNLSLELIVRDELTIGIINNKRSIYLKNKKIKPPDYAIIRTIEPLLNLHLEACGIRVFNNSYIARICNDKALTHHYMLDFDIPMVNTVFFKKHTMPLTSPLSYPCIIKETTGKGGMQVYYIKDKHNWQNQMESLSTSDFIVQSCDVQLGKDIRVFVVGKEIIGAVMRYSTSDFRANYKLGGSVSLYNLTKQDADMIEKIISHFDFGMVGIDFLIGKNGELLFNEIEDVVGSRTLSVVSNLNILQTYVTHIKSELRKRDIN